MVVSGDRIEALIGEHGREVYGLLLAITRNPTTAEDLTQEVFVVALRRGIEPGPGMRAWLREVARRLAMNELRRRRPATLGGGRELAELAGAGARHPESQASGNSFDDELAALRRCLTELEQPDRAVLSARYERGEPLAGIAARCRQSEGYMKQRLLRLRRRLAECIRRRMAGSGAADG